MSSDDGRAREGRGDVQEYDYQNKYYVGEMAGGRGATTEWYLGVRGRERRN